MRLGMILVAMTAVAWLGACSDSTDPDPVDSSLRGTVVDALGQPVAGATVVLQYAVDPPIGSPFDKPATQIRLELPESGPVTLWISSYCDGDTVRMLVDGEMPPGQHMIAWDGRDDAGRTLPDGVYRLHLVTVEGQTDSALAMMYFGYQLPEAATLVPLAVTDAHGRFALSQGCLPFGFRQDAVDEQGNITGTFTVTRTVRVWAYDPQSGALTSSSALVIDAETGADVTVDFD